MFCQNMLSQVRRSQPSRQPSPKMPDLHAKQDKQTGPVCTILGTMHCARKVSHKQLGIWTLQALAMNTLLFIRVFLIHVCHICILHNSH